jgi:hypothetical protein
MTIANYRTPTVLPALVVFHSLSPRNHKLITALNRRTRFDSGKQRPTIINSELRARIECASRLQLHKLYSGIQCSHAEAPASPTAT